MKNRTWIAAGLAALLIGTVILESPSTGNRNRVQAESGEGEATARAVEPSMHEFMEYVFQPPYKRLRAVMASEPADNAAWKAIKSDSLILAEAGNLLLIRRPDENESSWRSHAVEVRSLGGQFYQAARKKDYAAATKHWSAMLQKCNSCHKTFADGKYQLTP